MKLLLKYSFSLIFLLVLSLTALAQVEPMPADTLKTSEKTILQPEDEKDKLDQEEQEDDKKESQEEVIPQYTRFLQSVDIMIDYLKLTSFLVPYEEKAEGGISFLLRNKFIIALEGGYGDLQPRNAYRNSNYRSTGIYGRVGLDYMFPIDQKNNMFIGARYGQSRFEERAQWKIESSLYDSYSDSFHRTNLQAHWSELIIGSESQYKANLFIGFIFRFRVMHQFEKFEGIPTFSIPGYGRTSDKTIPAFNLFVKYKIR
jgi:hypothetical protein